MLFRVGAAHNMRQSDENPANSSCVCWRFVDKSGPNVGALNTLESGSVGVVVVSHEVVWFGGSQDWLNHFIVVVVCRRDTQVHFSCISSSGSSSIEVLNMPTQNPQSPTEHSTDSAASSSSWPASYWYVV